MLKLTSDYPPPPGTLKPTSTYRGYTEWGGITKLGHLYKSSNMEEDTNDPNSQGVLHHRDHHHVHHHVMTSRGGFRRGGL